MPKTREPGARGYVITKAIGNPGYRRKPRLSEAERSRRATRARRVLIPAAIRATGRKGFYATEEALRKYEDHITDPTRLSGWLKARAKERGILSPEHPYVGRRKKRRA